MDYPPLPQFEAWLREWQAALSLQAWELKISLVPSKKLANSKHTAECWANHKSRSAEILISRDEEAAEYLIPESFDWEETVVHELLHVVFDAAEPQEPMGHWQLILYEQGINAVAKALVTVKRANRG